MTESAELIEKMYGHHYTPQTVSNMTKAMAQQVEFFAKSALAKRYVCVYIDLPILQLNVKLSPKRPCILQSVFVKMVLRKY
ncbi:transposase [Paenibacillus alvei]|uniref:transposase n=1 Tax=Paenibacillus alvei TaxID=44250 RepID=UPI0022812DF5|nr:transposase [Paenibacillus alvei]